MCCGRNGIDGDPPTWTGLAHKHHVHPRSKVCTSDEWLVKPFNSERPVEDLHRQQKTDRDCELRPEPVVEDQVGDHDGHTELRQHIPELPDDFAPVDTVEQNPEEEENQAAPDHMAIDVGPACGELYPLVERVDHRHADDEHEKGLDQIPEVEAIPRVVRELAG